MKITLFLAILVLLAAGTLVVLNRVGHSHAVPLNCEASFHYQDATPGEPLAFDGALTFHFSGTQAGQFFLTSFTICCFCCSNFSPESGAAVATPGSARQAASESAV